MSLLFEWNFWNFWNNFSKLKNPFHKTDMGQKAIYYIGPPIWNSFPDLMKRANSLNTFKHNVKKHYLTWITHTVIMWICVSVFIHVCISVGTCIYTYPDILVDFPLSYSFFFISFTLLLFLFWPEGYWCYSYMSAVIFQLSLYILTFNQYVCLFVCFT